MPTLRCNTKLPLDCAYLERRAGNLQRRRSIDVMVRHRPLRFNGIIPSIYRRPSNLRLSSISPLPTRDRDGNFEGSVMWYVTTVILDLEALGEIKRIPHQDHGLCSWYNESSFNQLNFHLDASWQKILPTFGRSFLDQPSGRHTSASRFSPPA